MPEFQPYSEEVPNPIFVWLMKPDVQKTANGHCSTFRNKLAQKGWMVPAYTMPANIEQIVVMRVLCKQGFSRDMADQLLNDIRFCRRRTECVGIPYSHTHIHGKKYSFES